MGHLSANPAGRNPSGEGLEGREPESNSHRWLWILALAVVIGGSIWYFRAPRSSTEAQGPTAPGGSKGQGRGAGSGGFVVPVVVATAQRGDLPVYFDGLGTVTAFNTVTVHSRVDGQIT